MGKQNPQDIAREIRDGSQSSFEIFFRLEFDNVTHFIESYTHDHTQAEDLAQETFCSLWDKRATIDPAKNFRAFVFRIARNKTINALRTKEPTADSESRLEIGANVLALSDSSMEGIIEGLELGRLIQDVYDSLPDSAKDSFIMSRKYGMTNKEIAEKEGLTVKAVEYHIKISLRIFKEKLKDYLPLLLWWLLG